MEHLTAYRNEQYKSVIALGRLVLHLALGYNARVEVLKTNEHFLALYFDFIHRKWSALVAFFSRCSQLIAASWHYLWWGLCASKFYTWTQANEIITKLCLLASHSSCSSVSLASWLPSSLEDCSRSLEISDCQSLRKPGFSKAQAMFNRSFVRFGYPY